MPHGGSSYYLSRLPGELGTYLALTGLPLNGEESRKVGLADMFFHDTGMYDEIIREICSSMDWPMPTGHHLHDRFRDDKWRNYLKSRNSSLKNTLEMMDIIRARQKQENKLGEEFFMPKDRKVSVTANSEYEYKLLMNDFNR